MLSHQKGHEVCMKDCIVVVFELKAAVCKKDFA